MQCNFAGLFSAKLAVVSISNPDFMYQEAFLTTYRTFITSRELIEKLVSRYSRFSHMTDPKKKRFSRLAFSLLVRVVDELW